MFLWAKLRRKVIFQLGSILSISLFLITIKTPVSHFSERPITSPPESQAPCRVELDTCAVHFYTTHCAETPEARATAIKDAVQHLWSSYQNHAWGSDFLKPLSKLGGNGSLKMGESILESMATLQLVGLSEEFWKADQWLKHTYQISRSSTVKTKTLTTSLLASLLELHYLTDTDNGKNYLTDNGTQHYLSLASEIGSIVRECYPNPDHLLPMTLIDLDKRQCGQPCRRGAESCLISSSDITSSHLELLALARVTGEEGLLKTSQSAANMIAQSAPQDGLLPGIINRRTATFQGFEIDINGAGLGYYSGLLKQWILTRQDSFKHRYLLSVHSLTRRLVSEQGSLTVLGRSSRDLIPEMSIQGCGVSAMLALGYHHGIAPTWHLNLAERLAKTCYLATVSQPTGLTPAVFRIESNGELSVEDSRSELQPDFLESLLVLWLVTGKQVYRHWGWEVFRGIERSARTCSGYTGVLDVKGRGAILRLDKMESWVVGGTLKFLWLLFSEEAGSSRLLDEWVFSERGHMIRIE
eukprot:sb/3463815/